MSVYQTQNGLLKQAAVALGSTSATTIVAATETTGAITVENVRCAEVGGATPTLTIDIYDGSTAYKIRVRAMTAGEVYIDDAAILLEPGWSLRATAGTADRVHVTALYSLPR